MHTLKRGQRVAIINQTIGGKFVLEGYAKILCRVLGVDEQYRVQFESDKSVWGRFVDPAAQENPAAFIDRLNRAVA